MKSITFGVGNRWTITERKHGDTASSTFPWIPQLLARPAVGSFSPARDCLESGSGSQVAGEVPSLTHRGDSRKREE